ncbi:MAG: hypothetical protein U0798_13880 [Gemmataceae bacterium]
MRLKKQDYRNPKWVSKKVKELVDITNEAPREKFYSDVAKELLVNIDMPLKKNKFQSVYGLLTGDFSTLASRYLSLGAAKLYNNNESGWEEIRKGILYDKFSAKFRHAFIVKDNCFDDPSNIVSGSIFAGKEALTFCLALVLGDLDFVNGFGRHVLKNFIKSQGGDKIYFYSTPFFPFVLKLYSLLNGVEIQFRTDVKTPLGRYQQIFENWNSAQNLVGPILDVCDYHCEQSVETGELPAFAYLPYTVLPVEIYSLFCVRKILNLDTPIIDHPILDCPLLRIPSQTRDNQDEITLKAQARLHRDFQSFDNLW